MKKNIFMVLYCLFGLSGFVYAAVDPVPGIDVIVERDPEDEPITVGACQKAGLLILKDNAGKWRCVSREVLKISKNYTKYPHKKIRFKTGADLSKKVN